MHKLWLFLLVIHSSLYPMLGPVMRSAFQSPVMAGRYGVVMQTQRPLTTKASEEHPSVTEFIQLLQAEKQKIHSAVLVRLRHREISDAELDSNIKNVQDLDIFEKMKKREKLRWHMYEKYRALALAELSGRDKVNISQAVEMQDHEVLAHLLQCGADANDFHAPNEYASKPVDIAMRNDDFPSLKLLMDAGAYVNEITNISGMSVEMFKHLLDQGFTERDPWHHQSYVRDLAYAIGAKRSATDSRNFMLKVMLAVNSGASANPYIGRGGNLLDSHFGRDLEGQFPDFMEYVTAVHTLESDLCDTKKRAARRIIRKIMKKYNIKENEVSVVYNDKAESSRVQEAD